MSCNNNIIEYSIIRSSPNQNIHHPRNILVNKPDSSSSSSRWCCTDNYITLRLATPTILDSITFGKYHKPHWCNLKRFQIMASMTNTNFVHFLSGGLENNTTPETFSLQYTRDGQPFPVQYVKIIPQQAWGSSFNVELRGITDPELITKALFTYNSNAEERLIKACLKHFRQQGYTEAFNSLRRDTGIQLEAPQLTELYTSLVDEGDFINAEKVMKNARDDGLFDWYVSQKPYTVSWTNLNPCSTEVADRLASGESGYSPQSEEQIRPKDGYVPSQPIDSAHIRPGQRGGHQMCIDSDSNTVYLFGGWDGVSDSSDLWSYYVPENKWTLLYKHSEKYGGPSPRSCHKMVLHNNKKQIFTLGRYVDVKYRMNDIKSDMYVYDIENGSWLLICEDTAAKGGPKLIFDHQMCVDSENNIIYIFGGRILSPSQNSEDGAMRYSGLYSYDIENDVWKLLLADVACPTLTQDTILSRVGHSMLFHPNNATLYVVGGQRNKEHLVDLLAINISKHNATVQSVCTANSYKRSPPTGFTQRATIDPSLNEIYVLSGFSKDKEKQMSNSLWVFSLTRLQWSCIYRNDDQSQEYWSKIHSTEPCPRFAHQFVYDSVNKIHYLFGGNPGSSSIPSLRLDDLWALQLHRVCGSTEWTKAKRLIRKLKFEELASNGMKREALDYLQTHLHQTINHSNPDEAREFQLLTMMLFSETRPVLSFHPPARSVENTRPDPELHSDLDDLPEETTKFPSESCEEEQQTLFAEVLGMDTDQTHLFGERVHKNVKSSMPTEKWDKLMIHYKRCELFQELSEYFPPHMSQPNESLTDYVHL